MIYHGKTLTGYRSRNDIGYELNIDGSQVVIESLSDNMRMFILDLINTFTPFKKPDIKIMSEVDIRIENLEKELAALRVAL